ncbi:MAG: excinuclease ABC subunit UvrA [Bacteroidia bacterium]|nr:excinuclease ABC subunit UvrA [Bacteroidia bacterium]
MANGVAEQEFIEVIGARMNNLKDLHIKIPRNQFVVITGISGSGKSSLAFDTIYAEGQRRYMETFTAYARQFIGDMERPDVDKITGLSPVISIDQKTTSRNPRSTVGTVTEIYDFLRLLYARMGEAYSYNTGKKMVRYSEDQMLDHLFSKFKNKKIVLLAPLVRARKGHYRELFEQIRRQGYNKVRVDGEILDIKAGMQVDRYKVHDIEVVVDRFAVKQDKQERIRGSLATALKMGNDSIFVKEHESTTVLPLSKKLVCPETGISYEEPSPNAFSFNSPYGACPHCNGLGKVNQVDIDRVIPDDTKSINEAGIVPFGDVRDNMTFKQLKKIAKQFSFSFNTPIHEIPEKALNTILYGDPNNSSLASKNYKHDFVYDLAQDGLFRMLRKWYEDSTSEKIRRWAEEFMMIAICPDCQGQRLKLESRHFKIHKKNIAELAMMDINELAEWMNRLGPHLSKRQQLIGTELLKEIRLRIQFLLNVGLDYLSLNRPARTLSGGESQRIRLATQIGSKLTGITYVLDEPSIGLHQRDNHNLIDALKELAEIGNSVLVVEHDRDIMLASDYLIDMGPGAGEHGGEIVGEGVPDVFIRNEAVTSEYLLRSKNIEVPTTRRKGNGLFLELKGAKGNNLHNVSVKIPLGKLICVTGVSGSGKSTLINETLYPILRQQFHRSLKKPLNYSSLTGIDHLDKVIEIDQSPIGRTPRSNPATYVGVFSNIRKLFSELPESKIRGYKTGQFSFNVKGGRCEECRGAGKRVIEMNFLPDVQVDCEVCMGLRYNRETLEIHYKNKSISDVLNMTVEEATEFFKNIPSIFRKLRTLREVGLGYITLGQQATTLSGGEAQRVKLSLELSKKDTGKTFYILDEPTTGLHFQDIQKLLDVINRLVDKGNTVLIIEHNMDVIKVADHIIDIGPEGGRKGGKIVAQGTPEKVAKSEKSYTGKYLKEELSAYFDPP